MINDSTQYIARISYGKDSLKMLEVIHSRGLPLDRITTTDVWATDTISANLPTMDAFKSRMDEWIWTHYRIEVEHLCARNKDGSKRTYEQMFYHVPVRKNSQPVQAGSRFPQESIQGFPDLWNPWCQSGLKRSAKLPPQGSIKGFPGTVGVNWRQKLKLRVQTPFLPGSTRRARKNIVEYIGIAADEPDRFGQLCDRKRAPLVEFGIDEGLCGLYCQYNDMLAPTYETSCRDGCWFCHNQGVDQLRSLRRDWPHHWALLMKWDLDSPVTFKADGHTVHDFDRRFQMEDEGLIPTDRSFRWSMLENPPRFVPWVGEQLSLF